MNRHVTTNIICALTLYLTCNLAFAKTHQVDVYMVKIQQQKMINDFGDHLYFSMTEYPTTGDAKLLRFPSYPLHWESKYLPCLKNIKIWSGKITDDNSVIVVFSLMDQTFAVFEEENLIGSIMVEISNKNNKITAQWAKPHYADLPKIEKLKLNKQEYLMFGSGGRYLVEFKTVIK